ncbi:DUF2309 domain-containing protein [bacterium]|nr:DUF2309 domain-containing protein [bacterium]
MSGDNQTREPEPGPDQGGPEVRARRLHEAIGHAAHLLPAQGPISIFIHHNTLHAFEDRPFEDAVVAAGRLFGCEPFLPEGHYRNEFAAGRIREIDLRDVLARDLGDTADTCLGDFIARFDLRFAALARGIDAPAETELRWLIEETALLRRFRDDAPHEARGRVIDAHRGAARALSRGDEPAALRALWSACVHAAERATDGYDASANLRSTQSSILNPQSSILNPQSSSPRHRDALLVLTGRDADALAHPILIRVCAAFLDQGIAYWPMPDRDAGLYAGTRDLYGREPDRGPGFPAEFARLLAFDREAGRSAEASAVHSLSVLGVGADEWDAFVAASLLALRGWAGMIRQVEERPDRVPSFAPPARLVDFLALRLLADRAACAHVLLEERFDLPLADLRDAAGAIPADDAPRDAASPPIRDAYVLYQVAQLAGRSAREVGALDARAVRDVLDDIEAFGDIERRRLWHLAYERRHRIGILDALAAHHDRAPRIQADPPRFQAMFCIDEREESIRRHLEEVEPACETFGYAGFFGVAMYYRGASDAHPRPLCPVVIRPAHEVTERILETHETEARVRRALLRRIGRMRRSYDVGSRTFTRGAVLTAMLGALAAFPLIARVLFPRTAARVRHRIGRLTRLPARTQLSVERDENAAPMLGERAGYDIAEMASIVAAVLRETGLAARLSRLVVIVGHGSSSLNNPHESAHDCGACGGGRGGPNARAFALMANNPAVREELARRGVSIPPAARFVGAEHNSCNDAVSFFDDEVPTTHRADFEAVRVAFDAARERNAHERCRRFDHAGDAISPAMALEHVEMRTEDLAQPRPEYGHATNAVCVVGRRERTRGLFLDRRAFLVSYDPSTDGADGAILERVLAAVVPVCAGISLEYYFSFVDPIGYGCGTKLPHNISAMLGVMDGHASDLRTGLPWQMVEIHEPVRLVIVVETDPDTLLAVLARLPAIDRLVRHRWITLATLAPGGVDIRLFEAASGAFVPHEIESDELPIVASSARWYAGRRDPIACATIAPAGGAR